MRKILLFILPLLLFLFIPDKSFARETLWDIQSVDTMKYSRDASRDPAVKNIIPIHIKAVADTGANYVALDTPYDDEFIPILKLWVNESRKHNLRVWFRGNFSGWEGWFEYPKLKSTNEHNTKTFRFITQNPDLFKDGDIYTPAPEPENGIMGDPRRTGKHAEFNKFLLDSFNNCQSAFKQINKNVDCGVWSMNTDVLRETVAPETIKKMGSVISIDHYTKTPEKLIEDVKALNKKFNAKVVLGEFGAPIPDINGEMTDLQQKEYIEGVLKYLYENKQIVKGANYWVIAGGSTKLLNSDNTPRPALLQLRDYFDPVLIIGHITDGLAKPIQGVSVSTNDKFSKTTTDSDGNFKLTVPNGTSDAQIIAEKKDYVSSDAKVSLPNVNRQSVVNITLEPADKGIIYTIKTIIKDVVEKIR